MFDQKYILVKNRVQLFKFNHLIKPQANSKICSQIFVVFLIVSLFVGVFSIGANAQPKNPSKRNEIDIEFPLRFDVTDSDRFFDRALIERIGKDRIEGFALSLRSEVNDLQENLAADGKQIKVGDTLRLFVDYVRGNDLDPELFAAILNLSEFPAGLPVQPKNISYQEFLFEEEIALLSPFSIEDGVKNPAALDYAVVLPILLMQGLVSQHTEYDIQRWVRYFNKMDGPFWFSMLHHLSSHPKWRFFLTKMAMHWKDVDESIFMKFFPYAGTSWMSQFLNSLHFRMNFEKSPIVQAIVAESLSVALIELAVSSLNDDLVAQVDGEQYGLEVLQNMLKVLEYHSIQVPPFMVARWAKMIESLPTASLRVIAEYVAKLSLSEESILFVNQANTTLAKRRVKSLNSYAYNVVSDNLREDDSYFSAVTSFYARVFEQKPAIAYRWLKRVAAGPIVQKEETPPDVNVLRRLTFGDVLTLLQKFKAGKFKRTNGHDHFLILLVGDLLKNTNCDNRCRVNVLSNASFLYTNGVSNKTFQLAALVAFSKTGNVIANKYSRSLEDTPLKLALSALGYEFTYTGELGFFVFKKIRLNYSKVLALVSEVYEDDGLNVRQFLPRDDVVYLLSQMVDPNDETMVREHQRVVNRFSTVRDNAIPDQNLFGDEFDQLWKSCAAQMNDIWPINSN